MNNPTFVQCHIILPGAQVDETLTESDITTDVVGIIENEALGERVYSVTRDKMVRLSESDIYREPVIQVDSEGKLAETLFIVMQMTEISPRAGWENYEWMVDYMANAGWEDLNEGNMKALYDIAMEHIGQAGLHDPYTLKHFHVGASFIVDWTINSSTDYWTGYSEIDAIDVESEMELRPKA